MAYADERLADEEWLKKYEAENEENKRLEQEFQARLLTRRCSSSGVLMSFRKSFRGSTVYCKLCKRTAVFFFFVSKLERLYEFITILFVVY